jgi:hypothetical protein
LDDKYEVGGMTKERYGQLFNDVTLNLTEEEANNGWYFSDEFDGLLIHTSWEEHILCGGC